MLVLALILSLFGSDYVRTDYVKSSKWSKTRAVVLQQYGSRCMYTTESMPPKFLDIDHIIPAKYAHTHGMADSSVEYKQQFGMDTANLVPVSAHVNRSKGDDGPSLFIPDSNRCFYATKWSKLSKKYKIKMDVQDKLVIQSILSTCKSH